MASSDDRVSVKLSFKLDWTDMQKLIYVARYGNKLRYPAPHFLHNYD